METHTALRGHIDWYPDLANLDKVVEGKTKMIFPIKGMPGIVEVVSKDHLTKNNDPTPTKMDGKGVLSTTTTANIFELFRLCGIPVAYIERHRPHSFVALHADMVKLEVVGRVAADGSYRRRNPSKHEQYERLPEPVIEFFLKTSGKKWGDIDLPDDDPLALYRNNAFELYHPAKPLNEQMSISIRASDVFPSVLFFFMDSVMLKIREFAMRALLVLDRAFAAWGYTLCDVKFEFGFTRDGRLVLADVVDADSMRVRCPDGIERSKQAFRNNVPLEEVKKGFEMIAQVSGFFSQPEVATRIIAELA